MFLAIDYHCTRMFLLFTYGPYTLSLFVFTSYLACPCNHSAYFLRTNCFVAFNQEASWYLMNNICNKYCERERRSTYSLSGLGINLLYFKVSRGACHAARAARGMASALNDNAQYETTEIYPKDE